MGPLFGFSIGITGHRRSAEQAEMLSRRGAEVMLGPVVRTVALDDVQATVDATSALLAAPVDYVVLTTGVGTRSWLGALESAGLDMALYDACENAAVVARGPKARSAGILGGLEVSWQAPGETSDEIIEHLGHMNVQGKRIAVQRDGGPPLVAERIRRLGADVVDIPVYRWELPEDDQPAQRLIAAAVAGRLDAVTFTSAISVQNAMQLAPDEAALVGALNGPVRAVAVGPVTADALRRRGVGHVVEPGRARLGAMVKSLVGELTGQIQRLSFGGASVRRQGAAIFVDGSDPALLTSAEVRVLDTLVARGPAVVPKAALVQNGTNEHTAEVVVARLRSKLGPLADGIRTVPRRGYACELSATPAAD